jgi:hypothetical protein
LKVTTIEEVPSGALEGIMALICVEFTKTGMASTEMLPCVIFMETPLNVVPSGNADALTPVAGPNRDPKTENSDPRAIEPAGNPGGVRLEAALTIPFGAIRGCPTNTPAETSSAPKILAPLLYFKSTSVCRNS